FRGVNLDWKLRVSLVGISKIVCNAFQTLRSGCGVVGKGYTVFSVSGGYCRTSQMSKVKYLFFQLKIS
uniref:hypothetical protein n=1 Tax=uncultured Bacteroides sp. TaxID=162156 RepID=UPI00280BF921